MAAASAKATTAKIAVKDAQRGARTLIPLRVSATDYFTLLEKLATHSQKKKETQEVHELQEVYEMDVLEVAAPSEEGRHARERHHLFLFLAFRGEISIV